MYVCVWLVNTLTSILPHLHVSRRSADVFPVVPFGGREATTGNTSGLRRLTARELQLIFVNNGKGTFNHSIQPGVRGA